MEKRYEIVRLPRDTVDEIVRLSGAWLFSAGCAWEFEPGRVCGLDIQYRATETIRYAGKRREREAIFFFCEGHAIRWGKQHGAHGMTDLFPLLVRQP